MKQPSFDIAEAERWFAMSLNNRVWDWLESGVIAEPTDAIVHAAHASYHYWLQAGDVVNEIRAACLVANVHAAVGSSQPATIYAQRCVALAEREREQCTDRDLAFAHDCLARAMATGRDSRASAQKKRAREVGDQIADADDKKVFDDWFENGIWHALS